MRGAEPGDFRFFVRVGLNAAVGVEEPTHLRVLSFIGGIVVANVPRGPQARQGIGDACLRKGALRRPPVIDFHQRIERHAVGLHGVEILAIAAVLHDREGVAGILEDNPEGAAKT